MATLKAKVSCNKEILLTKENSRKVRNMDLGNLHQKNWCCLNRKLHKFRVILWQERLEVK